MNTMNDTKKPRALAQPREYVPPPKYQWTRVPIENKEGVVVKRPLDVDSKESVAVATTDLDQTEEEQEDSEEELLSKERDHMVVEGEEEGSKQDGI